MQDTPAGTVEVRRRDGIAILTLTRPSANNRITRQMAEAGAAALEEVRTDRRITGCVLTGPRATSRLGKPLGLPETAHGLLPLLALAVVKDALVPPLTMRASTICAGGCTQGAR